MQHGKSQSAATQPISRSFHLTPDRCVILLLAVEGVLLLSARFHWFAFDNQKGFSVLITVGVVGAALLLMLLWFIVSLLLRWRFQFSVRSLLLLTVVVAIPCSWLAAAMKQARYHMSASGDLALPRTPPRPAWLRSLLVTRGLS